MNEMVKNSVESRRTAIFSTYAITDEKLIKKIEDYFSRLNEFASTYNDVMKFESEFATSELSKEYADLFLEISSVMNPSEEKQEYTVADEIKDDIKHGVRREIRQEAYDKVRDIPGVGTAMSVKQHFDFFSRFKRNKEK